MVGRTVAVVTSLVVGCAGAGGDGASPQSPRSPAQASDDPPPQPSDEPSATPAPLPISHALSSLVAAEPAADAPAELAQYGQLVGTWKCRSSNRQPDDSWKDGAGESTWTWFYTLDGHAVQDVFQPAPGSPGAVGTNLRIYDPETAQWHMVWTTAAQHSFDQFTAVFEEGNIVMRGEMPPRDPRPAHAVRITFDSITDEAFDWQYEATTPGGAGPWKAFARLHCRRVARGLATPAAP